MIRMYDYECGKCGHTVERFVKDDETVNCPRCLVAMRRLPPIIRINMGVGAYGYYDETLGKYVSTNKQRREECRAQGVTPKGDTPKPDGQAWV